MGADEFFEWMAYELTINDTETKKKLLEQIQLETMDDKEKEAYQIKQLLMSITSND